MLPKDINNITEPVYKRLHGEIEDAIENIPVLMDIIDLFDVKVAARATTLQDVFDKFNELNLEYDTRYFIRQFKYGENQAGHISTQNMYDCILEINKVNYGSTTYIFNLYPLYFGRNIGTGTIQILKFFADAYPDFTKDLTYYSRYLVILGETNKHSTGVNDSKTYILKYINGTTRFIEDTGVGTKLYLHTINAGFQYSSAILVISDDPTPYSNEGSGYWYSSLLDGYYLSARFKGNGPLSSFPIVSSYYDAASQMVKFVHFNGTSITTLDVAASAFVSDTVTEL